MRRLLDVVNITNVDEPTGHAAGALRQAAIRAGLDPAPSGVDALVAAEADARATVEDVLITSDGGDVELLAPLGGERRSAVRARGVGGGLTRRASGSAGGGGP